MEFPIASMLFNKSKLKSLNFVNIISKTSFLNNIEDDKTNCKNESDNEKTTKNLKRPRDECQDEINEIKTTMNKKKCLNENDKPVVVVVEKNKPSPSKIGSFLKPKKFYSFFFVVVVFF